MANLDLKTAAHVYRDRNKLALTTSSQDLLPAIAANHVGDCYHLRITNVHATDTTAVTVLHEFAGGGSFPLAKDIPLPKQAVLIVASKLAPIPLAEGDKITATAGANGKLEAVAYWMDLS